MKKIVFALILLFVVGAAAWIGISVFIEGENCSEEKLQALRKEYPICYASVNQISAPLPLVDFVSKDLRLEPMPEMASLVKDTENYICVTVLEEMEVSEATVNAGFGKAGDETIVYRNYRVFVDQVVYGDSSLVDQTLVVTINRLHPVPKMQSGEKMILPVSKGEDGKYNLGPGSYYIAEGYVLSTFEENQASVYTGKRVEVLIRDIKKFGD